MSTRLFRIRLFKNKACLTLGFFYFFVISIYGQNQVIADSLELIYHSGHFEEKDRLQLLYELAKNHSNPEKKLQYSDELLLRATATDSTRRILGAYQERGNAYRLKGDHSHALESFLAGVKIADKLENKGDLGIFYLNIGLLYAVMGDDQNAIFNYQNAIPILKADNDSVGYAAVLENLGDLYNLKLAKPDSALLFLEQSGKIYRAMDYKMGIAYNIGNIGISYRLKDENGIAESNFVQAISMLEELGDYYPICVYLTYMSDIYLEKGDWRTAIDLAQRSLNLALQHNLKEQISDAYLKLSELYEKRGKYHRIP